MTKKNHPSPALTPQSEAEALVVQHALAFYRDMKKNAKNAPIGQFINCAEAVVLTKGRKLLCTTLQTLAQEEVNEVEKKTTPDSAEPVGRKNDISAAKQKTSKPPPEP